MLKSSIGVCVVLLIVHISANAQEKNCLQKLGDIQNRSNAIGILYENCRQIFTIESKIAPVCDFMLSPELYYKSLIDKQEYFRSYSIEEIQQIRSNGVKIASEFVQHFQEKPNKKTSDDWQNDFKVILQNQNLLKAILVQDLVHETLRNCEKLAEYNLSCGRPFSKFEVENLINTRTNQIVSDRTKIHSTNMDDFDSSEDVLWMYEILKNAKDFPIYDAPGVSVFQPDEHTVAITISISSTEYSRNDFDSIYRVISENVLNFWQGTLEVNGIQKNISVRMRRSDLPTAVKIKELTLESKNAQAAFNSISNTFSLNRVTLDSLLSEAPELHTLLHEVGHILGFPENYDRVLIDQDSCSITPYAQYQDVMDRHWERDAQQLTQDQLKFLYDTYGTQDGIKRRAFVKNKRDQLKKHLTTWQNAETSQPIIMEKRIPSDKAKLLKAIKNLKKK